MTRPLAPPARCKHPKRKVRPQWKSCYGLHVVLGCECGRYREIDGKRWFWLPGRLPRPAAQREKA